MGGIAAELADTDLLLQPDTRLAPMSSSAEKTGFKTLPTLRASRGWFIVISALASFLGKIRLKVV
jgi:hypothetical protein